MAAGSRRERGKVYDRRYFDRWYRDPRQRVRTPADLRRRVALAVATVEYFQERSLQSVLDVGCGEGAFHVVLKQLRPGARYLGVDPSAYAVARYGRSRGLVRGSLTTLDTVIAPGSHQLVVCSDVLHYLDDDDVVEGLAQLRLYAGTMLYAPVFTTDDDIRGDCRGFFRRTPGFYLHALARAGFHPCGLHCYLHENWRDALAAMERLSP